MNRWFLVVAILMPILFAVPIVWIPFQKRRNMEIYTELVTLLTSVLVLLLLCSRPQETLAIALTHKVILMLKLDGLGMLFSGLIAVLWPIAVLYSFEYMSHEERERPFFMFYLMTFGVTLGIAFSGNIMTMYFFYELLTLVTVPLVIHPFTREAVLATRKYIYFSMGGAALGFMGMVYLLYYGDGSGFRMGGILGTVTGDLNPDMMLFIYLAAFLGFSIKAALFPFYSWLPDAGVAPTPVTALLHAVAVVKAGAFAVMRLTYYCFGIDLVRGTWVHHILLVLAMFTIVFGCSMAVKETHIKRRLAYSTVSNLSYIIFGVTLMTPAGLFGALCHMVFHAIMKISAFFCAGAIMHQSGTYHIYEMTGFGKKMPLVYGAFTVSALGLMGVPGSCGFVSKWYLAQAAIGTHGRLECVGVGCLLLSALLTAIYMMTMIIRGFYPEQDNKGRNLEQLTDPGWQMLVPLLLFSVAIVVLGVYSTPLTNFIDMIVTGVV